MTVLPWRWSGGAQRQTVWPGSHPPKSAQRIPGACAQPHTDVVLYGPTAASGAEVETCQLNDRVAVNKTNV